MNKAVFLDRDGTINYDKHYLHKVDDFEFLPGVLDGLRQLTAAGFLLFIITNQSGIGRGYYTENELKQLNNWLIHTLANEGIVISEIYYCPHFSESANKMYAVDCNCRKPKTGLFYKAAREYQLVFSDCYAIGDKMRDLSICSETECFGYLVEQSESPLVINTVKNGLFHNVLYRRNLLEAAKDIICKTDIRISKQNN